MTRLARLICVSSGVALAVWLIPASIHIVDWTPGGPVRVAFLAPLWKLWAALAVGALAACAMGVSRFGSALTPCYPLALLWLWAIPYLPWLPDRAPALLALAGPLRWGVLAVALIGSVAALRDRRDRVALTRLPGRRTIVAVSFVVYLGFGLWSASAVGPDADEPHYLVITQSLLRDHDLAIENNHARGDYRQYFDGDLHPDFLRRGLNEVIYSIHAPGLPALLVPAYAAGGYRGAVVLLCMFGALTALAIFDLAQLLAGPGPAWLTWAAVCLTVPFVPHSWLIFPEIPGALLVAWAALWVYAPRPLRARDWIWRGAALAMLPWLHTKFVILLAALIAILLLRLWRTPRAAAALAAPVVASLTLWIGSFYLLYGVFDPQIPYGDFPRFYVLAANIPRGLLGLLFDQKFGLLIYAPIYGIAVAGCWMMLRRPELRPFGFALLATIGAFVASSARMYMWWGGSSAPARFLVPVLPLAAPMIAVALRDLRSTAARTVAALLLLVSLAAAVAGVTWPQRHLLFSAPHGLANLVAAAQGPAPLSYLLPTFTEDDLRAPLALLMPWIAAAAVVIVCISVVSRSRRRAAGFTAAAAGLTAFVAGGAILAGAPASPSQRRAAAQRGRLDLMRAYDGAALRGFDYAHRTPVSDAQVLTLSALHLSRAEGELTSNPARFAGPFNLPAGRFTLRTGGTGAVPPGGGGSIAVVFGERPPIARGQVSGATPIPFDLPVDAAVRLVMSDEASTSSVDEIDLVPRTIVPRRARPAVDVHAIDAIEGRPGAFIVYADDETYPEGGVFWTRGTRTGRVLVAAADASMLVLTLHVGPVGGEVRVVVGGQDRSVMLSPDQTRRIEIPIAPRSGVVALAVEAAGRFRPSDHDPGSADGRWLGCQVRVGLR